MMTTATDRRCSVTGYDHGLNRWSMPSQAEQMSRTARKVCPVCSRRVRVRVTSRGYYFNRHTKSQ